MKKQKNIFRLLPFLYLLILCSCSPTVPVITPVEAPRVKPGGRYEAVVLLPNNALASVYLHYASRSGRVGITGVAVVNHAPEKATIFFTRTKIYVDEGEPLGASSYRQMEKNKRADFDILKNAPEGAEGMWIIPRQKIVRRKDLSGPVVVIYYSIDGNDGFLKIRYNTIWGDYGGGY